MTIKLIALDLDGTLLDKNMSIPIDSINYINSLKKQNINIVIATGRTYTASKKYYNELNLTTPLITCNGSLIYEPHTNTILERHDINKDLLKEILTFLEKEKVFYQFYASNKIYSKEYKYLLSDWVEKNKTVDKKYKTKLEIITSPFEQLENEGPIFKVLIIEYDVEKYNMINQKMKEFSSLEVVSSFTGGIDIMTKGISKGEALKSVAKYLNIDMKHTLAIGDNNNDVTMLKSAKIGIAMENATTLAKENADYITLSNNENGVVEALKKYIKKPK